MSPIGPETKPAPSGSSTSPCPDCGIRIPRNLPDFVAQVYAERARLAMLDPAGEHDAIRPLDGVRARQLLLHLAEPKPKFRTRAEYRQRVADLDQRDLLDRLGADLGRDHGMVRCPAHEDRNRSLSWRWDGETAMVHCFAGCTFDEIRVQGSRGAL